MGMCVSKRAISEIDRRTSLQVRAMREKIDELHNRIEMGTQCAQEAIDKARNQIRVAKEQVRQATKQRDEALDRLQRLSSGIASLSAS